MIPSPVPSRYSPRRLDPLEEVYGPLTGVDPAGKVYVLAHIGPRNIILPVDLRPRLEELVGKRMAVTFIDGKHYVRQLKGEPETDADEE